MKYETAWGETISFERGEHNIHIILSFYDNVRNILFNHHNHHPHLVQGVCLDLGVPPARLSRVHNAGNRTGTRNFVYQVDCRQQIISWLLYQFFWQLLSKASSFEIMNQIDLIEVLPNRSLFWPSEATFLGHPRFARSENNFCQIQIQIQTPKQHCGISTISILIHTTIIMKRLHSKSSRLSENIRKRRGEKVDILKVNQKNKMS